MSKALLKKVTSINLLTIITIICTCLYFLLKLILFTNYPSPIGDEANFLDVFNAIEQNGFMNVWASGNISPLYYLIAYPLNSIFNNPLFTFRFISLTSSIITFVLLYNFGKKNLKLSGFYFYSSLLFIFSFFAFRVFWQGINDSLFHLLIVISFFNVYNILYKKNVTKNLILLGLVIGLLIGTRVLAFLVIPGYIFFFHKNFKGILIVGVTALFIGSSLQFPSIYNSKKIASVDKNPKNGMTWSQKNYLSQQYIYEGKIEEGSRVTWKELENYIEENGSEDLPNSFLETITYNPKWTLKELFNDFWYSIGHIYWKFFGLGILLLIAFTFYGLKNQDLLTDDFKFTQKLLMFFWTHTFFISLVVLTRIEARWYTAFICLGILMFHQILQYFKPYLDDNKKESFLKLNYLILIGFQLKFILTDSNMLSDFLRNTIKSMAF